jgi:hypothetical protein
VFRVALISLHTSPLVQPGSGDSGGMNVYVREVASALAQAGVECTTYTRATSASAEPEVSIEPGHTVVHIPAGPYHLPKEALPEVLDTFGERVLDHMRAGPGVDAIHANYWLSGVVGHRLKHDLGVPLMFPLLDLEDMAHFPRDTRQEETTGPAQGDRKPGRGAHCVGKDRGALGKIRLGRVGFGHGKAELPEPCLDAGQTGFVAHQPDALGLGHGGCGQIIAGGSQATGANHGGDLGGQSAQHSDNTGGIIVHRRVFDHLESQARELFREPLRIGVDQLTSCQLRAYGKHRRFHCVPTLRSGRPDHMYRCSRGQAPAFSAQHA